MTPLILPVRWMRKATVTWESSCASPRASSMQLMMRLWRGRNTESSGGDHELSQEELDAVFRPRQSRIISCIDDARGEAQLDAQITVAFRVPRSGKVSGVRLEAPAYLINHGLLACVRGIVQSLPFPPSSKAQIVTYPFSLH